MMILALFAAAMFAAMIFDLVTMTLPNRLTAGLAVGFLACAALVGMPWSMLGGHVLLGACALAVTFACFALGWMGGGDAKLIAATALWLGPSEALTLYVLCASLFGGLLTIALLSSRAILSPTTGIGFLDRLLGRDTGIPYGIALGLAGLVAMAQGPWMQLVRG